MRIDRFIFVVLISCCPPGIAFPQGDFWEHLPNVDRYALSSLAISRTGDLYVGNYEGVWKSTDDGEEWGLAWEYDGYAMTMVDMVIDSLGVVIVSFLEYSPYPPHVDSPAMVRSTDEGLSWERISIAAYMRHFAVSSENFVFVGGYNIFRSYNSGASWDLVLEPLIEQAIPAIAFDDEGTIYAAARSNAGLGMIYYSTNNGDWWLPWPSPARPVTCFAFSADDTVYAGVEDGPFAVDGGIFRSVDGGVAWERVMTIDADVVTILKPGSIAYASTFGQGVFRSADGGETWNPINSGLTGFYVLHMVAGPNGHLYALTNNSGGKLFRSIEVVTSLSEPPENLPEGPFLRQNYPNPFNSISNFEFRISNSSDVSLKIFNLLGEEVATLASGPMDAGTHTIQWDATGQPSGVYFYRLSAGDFVQTRKLMLLR